MTNNQPTITLPPKWNKIYIASRILLYLLFTAIVLFFAYQILFPEISLDYSFSNSNSLKNTLFSARTENQNPSKNGIVKTDEKLTFNANPFGNFEDAQLNFVLDKKSKIPGEINVNVQKSYAAFFYPEGKPVGYPDGTLLNADGVYYIVSDGKLRQFVSGSSLDQLGFSRSSFSRVTKDDLKYNPTGEDILNAVTYPNGTLVVVGNQYFQFKDQVLFPFVSDRAFLSKFKLIQAIPKEDSFLKDFKVSESFIGFADGTLASSDQSVFILSNGKSYPIADTATFVAMGFDWNNVLPLTPAEINAYVRQKQFTVNQPHPDGTIFYDNKIAKLFVIAGGEKHLIPNKSIAETYATNLAVLADSQSLKKSASCSPIKDSFSFRTYSCQLTLKDINNFVGNDYQFETDFQNEVNLASANVVFYTQLNQENVKTSLSVLKNRLQNNYIKK